MAKKDKDIAQDAVDEVMDEVVLEPDVVVEETVDTAADSAGATENQEVDNLRQQLLRVHADFDNFRKRTRQEKEDLQLYATRKLLGEILPVVDNFDRALGAANSEDNTDFRTGIEMVHRQLTGILEQYGVKAMTVVGTPFDPTFHEAVLQEAVDGVSPGQVVQELQKGYVIHDKVLRPAMVKVSV